MKPNYQFNEVLLDNHKQFNAAFFERFKLRHRSQPLQLNEHISKNYLFPTFYGDVTCAQAVYLCDYKKAQAMLPHPKIKPVKMPRGRALVAIACYTYSNVMNIPAYNEIAMTIPVMVDVKFNPPVLPMLISGFKSFGYYVFNMPVTSKENQIRGRKIWGLPKVVHEIDISHSDRFCDISAIDENGNEYFRLKVPTQGQPVSFDERANLYSKLGDRLLQSQTCFQASFNINKNMSQLFKKNSGRRYGNLLLGKGVYADQLRELELEGMPFQTRYAESMNACFDLPNEEYQTPFRFGKNTNTEGSQYV